MAIVSTGQITIIDYNDALSLTGFIGADKVLTQVYNPDNNTYTPSFTTGAPLKFTPSLFIMGNSADIITSTQVQSIKWYDADTPATELVTGGSYSLAAFTSGQNRPLSITGNILSGSIYSKTFICEVVYRDTTTLLNLTYKMSITMQRVNNSSGVTIAVVSTPNGNVFKNGSGTSLTAKADLLRGGSADTSSVTYQWYKQDPTVVTDQGGGVGWLKLISTATGGGTSGYATATLTIPTSAVTNIATFKCIITDTDTTSPTYNQSFSAAVTLVDQTDPIQVSVTSSGGDVFKNGSGSTTLTAKVFQAGTEIDAAGTKYTYKWYKYDQNAVKITGWGGTGIDYKTGKTLAIGGADVDVKATFMVDVEL